MAIRTRANATSRLQEGFGPPAHIFVSKFNDHLPHYRQTEIFTRMGADICVTMLPDWSEVALRAELGRHYGPYWQGLPTAAQAQFAKMLRDLPDGEVRVDLVADEDRDATRALMACHDHPGIFSGLAGALSLAGANIVDARTYTSKDGFATSAFWLQDAEGRPYEPSRLPRLRDLIEKILRGEVATRRALEGKEIKKRERKFTVATNISFDNEGSDIYTIIEVDTRDRPGLLYDLTQALAGPVAV